MLTAVWEFLMVYASSSETIRQVLTSSEGKHARTNEWRTCGCVLGVHMDFWSVSAALFEYEIAHIFQVGFGFVIMSLAEMASM